MAKSKLTLDIEEAMLNRFSSDRSVFACPEVTIGWRGKSIVDMITYQHDGTVTCYEIKVSKSDFHSKSKWTFVGHKNYFVMPIELYPLVSKDIPAYVGCWVYSKGTLMLAKKCRKVKPKKDIETILGSMVRSMWRELYKAYGARPGKYHQNLGTKMRNHKEDNNGL